MQILINELAAILREKVVAVPVVVLSRDDLCRFKNCSILYVKIAAYPMIK